METGVRIEKDDSQSKDKVACAVAVMESATCRPEEEESKERGKQKDVEVSANSFQAWNSEVTRDAFRSKVEEEKVVLASEERKTGEQEYFRRKVRGGEEKDDNATMRNQANEQGKLRDEMGANLTEEATVIEKHARENDMQWGLQLAYPASAVTSGSLRQKKKVFKKSGKTGIIFMCSHWMKQDCFDYKVVGLPASMRDVVQKVPKGTRLFLFDTDFRVMHGIYRAAAPGDYNVEPNAFKSVFPSQIRFTVVEECTPLAEENIRMAIKDSYNWTNMFYCQLTSEQVKVLSRLFVAASGGPSFCFKVKQENLIMDEENAIIKNKENTAIEEVNEAAATEVMMQNKEDTIVEDKTNELLCSQVDRNEEEIACDREEERTSEGSKGLIFLCNSMTKQDCLRYKLLGLPANKREIVERVHKGMRLFMFDVDSREMYGIYEAVEPGGYNVVPKAFNSRFPSQVRFTVLKDCIPLREVVFREAIKVNYYTKRKFHSQLTSDQVKGLCKLFSTATKDRDRVSQQNHDLRKAYEGDACIQRVVVPMAQFPPLDPIPPAYVSHGPANVIHRDGPLVRPHRQKRNRSWQLRNHDAEVRAVKSREEEVEKREEEEKRKKFLKDFEMNRLIVDECMTLGMLIQSTAAKGEALHLAVEKVEEDMKLLKNLEMHSRRVHEESMRLGMLIQSSDAENQPLHLALEKEKKRKEKEEEEKKNSRLLREECMRLGKLIQSTSAKYKAMLENTNGFYSNP